MKERTFMKRGYMAAGLALIIFTAPPAIAKEVKYKEIKASSTLPETQGVNYGVENLYDRRISTCWIEGKRMSSGLGEWLEFLFKEGGKGITGFEINNGNGFDYEFWERHNRLKEIEILLGDGTTYSFTLKDTMESQFISFPKPVDSERIRMTIKGIYSGTTFQDTCISEIWFHDTRPSDYIEVRAVKSSSILPATDESNYLPKNAFDRFVDTTWCEGKKDGGDGEWLQVSFKKKEAPKEVEIVNGVSFSDLTWFGNNRALEITLIYPSGKRLPLHLEDKNVPQIFPLPGEEASNIKVLIGGIKKGAKFNDTCISEITFR